MRFKIESRRVPDAELTALIREYRGEGKTVDSFLDACVSAAHDLNLTWYFRVDRNRSGSGNALAEQCCPQPRRYARRNRFYRSWMR